MAKARPGTDAYQHMPAAVVLAVCIARTLHQRDGKFLQALRTEIATMQQEAPVGSEAAKVLYAFGAVLEDWHSFPKA